MNHTTKDYLGMQKILKEKKQGVWCVFAETFKNTATQLMSIFSDKEKGLSPEELWFYKDHEYAIKKYVKNLNIGRKNFKGAFEKWATNTLKAHWRSGEKWLTQEMLFAYSLYVRSFLKTFINHKNHDKSLILYMIEKWHLFESKEYFLLKKEYENDAFVSEGMIRQLVVHNPRDPKWAIEKKKSKSIKTKEENLEMAL